MNAPGLLVSVRSVAEALRALAGGATLIDVKEPSRGSLGSADPATIAAVIAAVGGNRPVSAALGELSGPASSYDGPGLTFAKWGLSKCGRTEWRKDLLAVGSAQRQRTLNCCMVTVAYADWQEADAPPPEDVCAFAREVKTGPFLIDTYHKDGRTLLDCMDVTKIRHLCQQCQRAGVRVALAGSLGKTEVLNLRNVKPDWFAVRGAVCRNGEREASVDEHLVREMVALVSQRETGMEPVEFSLRSVPQ